MICVLWSPVILANFMFVNFLYFGPFAGLVNWIGKYFIKNIPQVSSFGTNIRSINVSFLMYVSVLIPGSSNYMLCSFASSGEGNNRWILLGQQYICINFSGYRCRIGKETLGFQLEFDKTSVKTMSIDVLSQYVIIA